MKILTSLLIAIVGISNATSQEVFQHSRLTKLWELKEGLKTPESVLYDPVEKVLYVSSINENPWQKDNNGFISKISTDGKIIKLKWATGFSAPKGMGISNGKLYVTNIDEVVEVELKNGSILKRFTHPKAVNLNDIAVNEEGRVFISDSKGDYLFQLVGDKLEILSDSPEIKASNGLYVKDELLLCGQKNRIVSFNLKTREISVLLDETGSIDGIENVGLKTYLFSDWSGHVFIVEPGKEKMLLLNTTPDKVNAADIGYNKSKGILYVPTFFNDAVVAYKLD